MSILATNGAPPRVEALLQSLGADPEFADDVIGDLAEEFAVRARWDGVPSARRWYYREALRTAPHLLRDFRRRFRLSDAAPFVWAMLAGFATGTVLTTVFFRATFWVTGVPLGAYFNHWQTTGELMPWLAAMLVVRQIVPAMTAGFVAGTVEKRAALAHSMVVATGLLAATIGRSLLFGVPLRVLGLSAINGGSLAVSCVAGGVVAALWRRKRRMTPT